MKIKCSLCNKYFKKKNNRGSPKYCPICLKKVEKERVKTFYKKNKKDLTLKVLIRNQLRNPTCCFQQGSYCVKKGISILGVRTYIGKRNKCLYKGKEKLKCSGFKPKYPSIVKHIKNG